MARPRKNAHQGALINSDGRAYVPLAPPRGTSLKVKKIWRLLVDAQSPDFFTESDTPLLLTYIESIIMLHDLKEELTQWRERTGSFMYTQDNGSVKMLPLVAAINQTATLVSSAAARCRLSPSSRLPTRSAATQTALAPDTWTKTTDGDPIDALFAGNGLEH